jgi:putative glutamine amidotransferase
MQTRRPRIGIPWRASKQGAGSRQGYVAYLNAVRRAGGAPVELPLSLTARSLGEIVEKLDAFVLPGSGSDVDPRWYGAKPHQATNPADTKRENMDFALLSHALPQGKPVLAICYGAQSLNVHLGGTLVQDIRPSKSVAHKPRTETSKLAANRFNGRNAGGKKGKKAAAALGSKSKQNEDAFHAVTLEGGALAKLAGNSKVTVNSWHHQAIDRPGRGLNVIARAPDKIIEAVEWLEGPGWAVGVQWHPERMPEDPLARELFRRLVSEARLASRRRTFGSRMEP